VQYSANQSNQFFFVNVYKRVCVMSKRKSVNSNASRRTVLDTEIKLQEELVKLATLKLERAKASTSSSSSDASSVVFESCLAVKDWIDATAADGMARVSDYESVVNVELGRPSNVGFGGLGRPGATRIGESYDPITERVIDGSLGRPSNIRFGGLGRPSATRIGEYSNQIKERVVDDDLGRPSDVRFRGLGWPNADPVDEQFNQLAHDVTVSDDQLLVNWTNRTDQC
jgi:hypothetical protein